MGVIIRQGFKAALSNYVGMGLGFLSLFILFPLFYEPDELGAIRIFLESGSVLAALALMGTHYSINRFFPFFRTQDEKHHGFFFWVVVFPLIGYILLTILLLIAGRPIFNFLNPSAMAYRELFPMLLLLIFIILYQIVSETTSANHGRIAVPNFMREIVMRSLIIISGLLYYFKVVSFSISIWLMVCSYLIALAGNIYFLSRLTKITLKPDFDFIRSNPKLRNEVLKFTGFFFLSGIVALIIPKLDLFLISSIKKNLSDVAVYSIGFYLATFIEVPKRTILQVATPIISNHLKNGNFAEVESLNKKNGTNQLLVSAFLFFLIWLNIDNLYEIMPRGEFYSKGKWVVFYIGISKLIDAVICGNSPIIANSSFYQWAIVVIIIAAVSGITYNYVLIPIYGILGGAVSTVLMMATVNLCNFLIVQYKLKINPFHSNQLKIIALLIIFLTFSFTGKWISNPFLDSFIRSATLGSIFLILIFKLRLSEDFNDLLKSKIPFLKKFKTS
jgi:O-antigen/teichoic acid export membrane protein